MVILSIILIILGMSIRFFAITQNKGFSYAIKKPDALCTTGIYGVVRHPGYTGNVICYLGIASLVMSWPAAFLFAFLLYTHLDHRVDLEEELLTREFPEYVSYKQAVGKFFPKVL